jgi:hypothetical protein
MDLPERPGAPRAARGFRPSAALPIVAALALAACASPGEPKVTVREVQVPVAVKCASDPGPQPAYADSDSALKAAPDLYERVKLLVAGRLQRIAREAELIAANSGCR